MVIAKTVYIYISNLYVEFPLADIIVNKGYNSMVYKLHETKLTIQKVQSFQNIDSFLTRI